MAEGPTESRPRVPLHRIMENALRWLGSRDSGRSKQPSSVVAFMTGPDFPIWDHMQLVWERATDKMGLPAPIGEARDFGEPQGPSPSIPSLMFLLDEEHLHEGKPFAIPVGTIEQSSLRQMSRAGHFVVVDVRRRLRERETKRGRHRLHHPSRTRTSCSAQN